MTVTRVGRISEYAYRIWVAELSDEAGPRVHPARPNIYVGLTIEDPERRFARLKNGMRPDHEVYLHGIGVRPDLYEGLPIYPERAEAKAAKASLIKDLRRQGFVVNKKARCYRIYVIELRDDVGRRRDVHKPWIYVGQTSKDIEVRFREHITAARAADGRRLYSAVVYKYHVKLRPDLYEPIPCVYLREDALLKEGEVARRFAADGYSVRGGH
jgi:hypothetical protein